MATLGAELKSSGITESTPKNIMLSAGTIHKGFKFDATEKIWNFTESLIGATSGGSKLTIKPELLDLDIDGKLVKVKNLEVKVGEAASLETNICEITPDILKAAIIGQDGTTTIEGYSEIISKPQIDEGDYFENFAYVGKKLDGTPIIVIFDNALCTSGLEIESKNKEMSVFKGTFECYQGLTGDFTVLPYHIYYPTPVATTQS